jgi:hypothetical protein
MVREVNEIIIASFPYLRQDIIPLPGLFFPLTRPLSWHTLFLKSKNTKENKPWAVSVRWTGKGDENGRGTGRKTEKYETLVIGVLIVFIIIVAWWRLRLMEADRGEGHSDDKRGLAKFPSSHSRFQFSIGGGNETKVRSDPSCRGRIATHEISSNIQQLLLYCMNISA